MLFFLSLSFSIIPFNQTWPPSSVLCVSSWHLHLSCSISQKPSSHQWHIPPFQPHSQSLRKSQPSIQPAKYSHICPLLFIAIATVLVPATIFSHLVWTIASSFSFEWFLFIIPVLTIPTLPKTRTAQEFLLQNFSPLKPWPGEFSVWINPN